MRALVWFLAAIYFTLMSALDFGDGHVAMGVLAALVAAGFAVLLFLEFDPDNGRSE